MKKKAVTIPPTSGDVGRRAFLKRSAGTMLLFGVGAATLLPRKSHAGADGDIWYDTSGCGDCGWVLMLCSGGSGYCSYFWNNTPNPCHLTDPGTTGGLGDFDVDGNVSPMWVGGNCGVKNPVDAPPPPPGPNEA